MAKRHEGESGARPGARSGLLLASLATLVTAVSVAIYLGVGGTSRPFADRGTEPGPAARTVHGNVAPAAAGAWVGTWSTSPAAAEPGAPNGFPGRSLRNVVHVSIGGTNARVHLSNLYGASPLRITNATVARAAGDGPAAVAGTMRPLTFGGRPWVVVPAGQAVVSDPARIEVPADSDLLVTTYTPDASGPVTYHPQARQTSYVADGERTSEVAGAAYRTQTPYWRYVTGVDVLSREARGSVVAFGDSLTDGVSSTTNANRRWPDVLADRLAASDDPSLRLGVLNAGISGNRVLVDAAPGVNPSGLSRFQRDVLSKSGVRTVVVDLGINDIIRVPADADADRIVRGLKELTARAHERGVRVVGATLMPFQGHRGYTPRLEAIREDVNREIRAGGVFDEVVDFDKALRDPWAPRRLREEYDSGDHLHPSDLGFRRMAEAVDLTTLVGSRATRL
ncbi:SGNH/GDSL hydrolase family protein [Streptomyces sp. NPDC060194]|uniref:SGNH/GDSL hydrolase family protein n=1 Tax=Streptomyces sp. NPDC060194 TaxID=3347069 RepID=UPI00364E57E2